MKVAVRRGLMFTGAIALVLAAVNLTAMALLRFRERREMNSFPAVAESEVFRKEPWGLDYWRDWRAGCRVPERLRYIGDGVWHLQPFRSRTINIEDDGLRRTENSDCREGVLRIAMFGGTMLWGHGAPDGLTIPSLLAMRFLRDGHAACVRNYGEWGSNTHKAMIELLREVRDPMRKPDIVILYAGSYDVKEQLFRSAGLRASEIDIAIEDGERARNRSSWIGSLPLMRLLNRKRDRFQRLAISDALAAAAGKSAAREVSAVRQQLAALGTVHRFTPIIIWHPYAVAGGKPLSREERANADDVARSLPALKIAIEQAYDEMRRYREANFYDLSDAFVGHQDRLYIDAGHLTPAGNAIVADRLYAIVQSALPPNANLRTAEGALRSGK
jgi:lysophospholipase L1-like esterase